MTVGETLSLARRERGLSVDDIAADTRIRATLIHAIEADRFALCGGAVYARGHIRSIARVLGVDSDPLVAEFDARQGIEHPAPTVVTTPAAGQHVAALAERHRPHWTMAMAAALVVICALAVAGIVTSRSGGGDTRGAGVTPPAASPPAPGPTPAAGRSTSSGADASPKATLVVRTDNGASWLSVKTSTGTSLYTGTLAAGHHKIFRNRHGLAVVIGNAPAVDVVVNGHDIGSPPSTGNVLRGNVSPGSATIQEA